MLPLAALFYCLSAIRRWAYRSGILPVVQLPLPVVVVGNISVGGVGKTPLVIYLVQQLRARGHSPGVVSRGYGGDGKPALVGAAADPARVGDEPVLIQRRCGCPVVVGRDRIAAARTLLAAWPDTTVIISDDGLQHYRLSRQVELAVVDQRGMMNGWLLPAGPLRETPSRLTKVDAVVGNGTTSAPLQDLAVPFFCMQPRPGEFYALGEPTRRPASADFQGQRVHAVAGIGSPQRFFDQLAAMGISAQAHAFPDHHAYVADELSFDGTCILTTEKDAVKLLHLNLPLPVWVLPIDVEIAPDLAEFVVEKLHGFPPA